LAEAREPSQRFDLDLADALPGQAELAPDLVQRLRLVVVEAVAEHEHLPLTRAERGQGLLQCLAAQGELDLLLREEPLAGDEVAEDGLRSEEHTSELQSRSDIVCRLLLEKKSCRRAGESRRPG